MKKIVVFCLGLLFFAACKPKGNSSNKNASDLNAEEIIEYREIKGTVQDQKRNKIAYAAVKLYLDEDDCMYAYTDDNGSFEFKVGELRIKDQSHFEIVYKGYAINMLSLRNYKESTPIVMSKKGKVVPLAEYNIFYESIKNCDK